MIRDRLLLLLLLTRVALPALAEPYAPVIEGKTGPAYGYVLEQVRASLPDRSEVEVPPCPKCVAMQVSRGEDGSLPSVLLLSKDPIDEVVAFYTKTLPRWKKSKPYDLQWVFSKDRVAEPDTVVPRTPQVHIGPASPKMLPDPIFKGYQTMITIYYHPTVPKKKKPTQAHASP
jgi:hypothetical protein